MKRMPFKRKPFPQKTQETGKNLFPHTTESKNLFNKNKSKDDEWREVREELKHRFDRVGITSCELKYLGCISSKNFGFGWTFAHSLKRVAISTEPEQRAKEIREVIYACTACHDRLEKMGNRENQMYNTVVFVIKKRHKQP